MSTGFIAPPGTVAGPESASQSEWDAPRLANELKQNAPNPFNPSTNIRYVIDEPGRVTLRIYSVKGELIRTLVDEDHTVVASGHSVVWDGRDGRGEAVASGVYLYRMETRGFGVTRKMVLLR